MQSPEGEGAEYRTKSASSLTKDEKMVFNDSGHKLQQLGSFQHLRYSLPMTSVMLFHLSIMPKVPHSSSSTVWQF